MRFLLFLFFCVTVTNTFAHDFECVINGVPVVKDTLNHRLLVSILPENGKSLHLDVELEEDDSSDAIEWFWNGESTPADFSTSIEDWHVPCTLGIQVDDNPVEVWNVVFTSLPVVDLNLEKLENISKGNPSSGNIRIVDAQGRTDGEKCFTTHLEAYYRGATALTFPKKSFTLRTCDEKGEDEDVNLLGIRSDCKWILDAMAVDLSRMRNRLCFDVWDEVSQVCNENMLRNGTKGLFVEVVLNGAYHGLYCLSDKVNRKLLGVKKVKKGDIPLLRGRLYKCQSADTPTCYLKLDNKQFPTDGLVWADWELKYPNENKYADTYQPLIDLMHFTESVVEDTTYVDTHLGDYFYEDNLADFAVFGFSFLLLDNCMHNSFLSFYNTEEDRRVCITPWDMDGSFGRDGIGQKLDWTIQPWMFFQKTEPFMTLIQNKESHFFTLMADHWMTLRENQLSVENVNQRIDDYVSLFEESGAWDREYERWNGLLPAFEETPEVETDYMKEWYQRNFSAMNRFFAAVEDGIDEVSGPSSMVPDVVYTIDGRRLDVDLNRTNCPKGIYIVGGRKVIR